MPAAVLQNFVPVVVIEDAFPRFRAVPSAAVEPYRTGGDLPRMVVQCFIALVTSRVRSSAGLPSGAAPIASIEFSRQRLGCIKLGAEYIGATSARQAHDADPTA